LQQSRDVVAFRPDELQHEAPKDALSIPAASMVKMALKSSRLGSFFIDAMWL
jgi:hypothetical protein